MWPVVRGWLGQLDPSNMSAVVDLGFDYIQIGDFGNVIPASPYDPLVAHFYGGKAVANFGLKNYGQAIEAARQAITINPNSSVQYIHATLVAALALAGHEMEAREALQRYLALPSTEGLKTIAAFKAYYNSQAPKQGGDPSFLEVSERSYDGLRKAGMPEE